MKTRDKKSSNGDNRENQEMAFQILARHVVAIRNPFSEQDFLHFNKMNTEERIPREVLLELFSQWTGRLVRRKVLKKFPPLLYSYPLFEKIGNLFEAKEPDPLDQLFWKGQL